MTGAELMPELLRHFSGPGCKIILYPSPEIITDDKMDLILIIGL